MELTAARQTIALSLTKKATWNVGVKITSATLVGDSVSAGVIPTTIIGKTISKENKMSKLSEQCEIIYIHGGQSAVFDFILKTYPDQPWEYCTECMCKSPVDIPHRECLVCGNYTMDHDYDLYTDDEDEEYDEYDDE